MPVNNGDGVNSAESSLVAQIRAGQEQTNARLEAVLAAIHQLCDLVARLAPVEGESREPGWPPVGERLVDESSGAG
jgi:hypothetical protein